MRLSPGTVVVFAFICSLTRLNGELPDPPWKISDTRPLVRSSYRTPALIGPSGDIYLSGTRYDYPWGEPTVSLGETSTFVNFIARLDPAGKRIYVIALGGTYRVSLLLDASGHLYVGGTANAAGFATTPGAYRRTAPADYADFICKLRAIDGVPEYCTYLDAAGGFSGFGVDGSGSAVIVGGPDQTGPVTTGALLMGRNIYVAKLSSDGSHLLYAAIFGGSSVDYPEMAAVDHDGNVFIAGRTYSADFPTTPDAVVKSLGRGPLQAASFLATVNPAGTALVYSTLGRPDELPVQLALAPSGEAQLLVSGSSGLLVRRYNVNGSGIVFETRLFPASAAVMAIDNSGVTTILGNPATFDIHPFRSTQTCGYLRPPAGQPGLGFMVRLASSGLVLQSTFIHGSIGAPAFFSLAVTQTTAAAAVWETALATQTTIDYAQLAVMTITPAMSASPVNLACLGNAAATAGAALAPGEIVSLLGEDLGPPTPVWARPGSDLFFPSTLADTEVTFDGHPAPLLYAGDRQIIAVTPFGISGVTDVCVIYKRKATNCIAAAVQPAAPGIFNQAVNQDGNVNSPENPAPVGSIVSLYATGLGALTPLPKDGTIVLPPLPSQNLRVAVEIPDPDRHSPNPYFGEVLYSGPAPFAVAGLSQINVRVPDSAAFRVWVTLPDGIVQKSNWVTIWRK